MCYKLSFRYNELNDYSYGTTKTTNGKAIGHFTQVVWKASVRIGVGLASVNSGGFTNTYIVARYAPQGNFVVYPDFTTLFQTMFYNFCPSKPHYDFHKFRGIGHTISLFQKF